MPDRPDFNDEESYLISFVRSDSATFGPALVAKVVKTFEICALAPKLLTSFATRKFRERKVTSFCRSPYM